MAIILVMNLSYFNSVISKEVLNDERSDFTLAEELKNLPVMVQELLLGLNFATTELFLKVLEHFRVFFRSNGFLRHSEVVFWACTSRS